ncbi:MAG: TatD family hydrolase [Deltaproteobacteria bacterium]|nr:TatD family hydrolase [Deltaproteobacteria bacterium]
MIDSHAHIHFDDFKGEIPQVIERARQAGVETIINVGTDLESSRQALEIGRNYSGIYVAIGFHPHEAAKVTREDLAALKLLAADQKVVAIGEIGLDYYYEHSPREAQLRILREQVGLAHEAALPLIIHCRDAFQDCFAIMDEEEGWKRGGVFHCFTGDWGIAQKILKKGFYLSFSGILTFKKSGNLREVAEKAPLEKILVETDCPYLAPEPHRGKRNEPAYVQLVAQRLAEIRGVSLSVIDEAVTRNLGELFRIPKVD